MKNVVLEELQNRSKMFKTFFLLLDFYNKLESFQWKEYNDVCPVKISMEFSRYQGGRTPFPPTPVNVVQKVHQ